MYGPQIDYDRDEEMNRKYASLLKRVERLEARFSDRPLVIHEETVAAPHAETAKPSLREMADKLATGGYRLNDFEKKFVPDIQAKLASGKPLTEKQAAKLEEFYAKHTKK